MVHPIKFVIDVKYNELVVLVLLGNVGPPRLEGRRVGDDLVLETAVVVRLNHGVRALGCNVVDNVGKVTKVVGIKTASEPAGCQALHQEVDAEEVHALRKELINLLGINPDVVLAVGTRNVARAKLGARLVDAEPLQLAS